MLKLFVVVNSSSQCMPLNLKRITKNTQRAIFVL